MAFQLLFGFLPWILLNALFGKTAAEMLISILVASAVFLALEWKSLRKGFILSWGTAFFLIFIFIFDVILQNSWVIHHTPFLSSIILATIAWISLLIGMPFTLQYARQQVAQHLWNKPGFMKVNQMITAIWGSIFLASAAWQFVPFGDDLSGKILHQILGYGTTLLGIWITIKFPNWYSRKQQKTLKTSE